MNAFKAFIKARPIMFGFVLGAGAYFLLAWFL